MSTVAAQKFPDEEQPTRPIPNLPSRILVRVERIQKLAEEATTLLTHPSGSRIAEAVVDLVSIKTLAREVLS